MNIGFSCNTIELKSGSVRPMKEVLAVVLTFLKERIDAFHPYHVDKGMTYEDGLMLMAALRFYERTGDEFYRDFLRRYLEFHIQPDGTITNYRLEDYNIDNILAGAVLFFMEDCTGDRRYGLAAACLRKQLEHHPRTRSGSFWHKLRYPNQIWLDGLYMGQPFYLSYGYRHGEFHVPADVMNQSKISAASSGTMGADFMYTHTTKAERCRGRIPRRAAPPHLASVRRLVCDGAVDLAGLFNDHDASAKNRLGAFLKNF